MEGAVLVAWRKQPGERLAPGDVVAEVETDKGILDVEAFHEGVLERHLIAPGDRVAVGAPMAVVREDGAGDRSPAAALAPSPPPPDALPKAAAPAPAPTGSSRLRASPYARRRADELGLSLAGRTGSGPEGAIVARDVEALAAGAVSRAPPPLDARARMRRAIAASMARSKREIPHYYVSHTLDMGGPLAWLARENASRSVERRLLPGVLLLRAVVAALSTVRELNAHWAGDDAPPIEAIHLGVAIAMRGGGLVAPAILDAGGLSLDDLMARFTDLVARAREGRLSAREMSAATITVTSLGDRGVEAVFPIIAPPQVAMVGFGKIVERPFVVAGEVKARPVVTATLAADHRVTDGHRGGLFLAAIEAFFKEMEPHGAS